MDISLMKWDELNEQDIELKKVDLDKVKGMLYGDMGRFLIYELHYQGEYRGLVEIQIDRGEVNGVVLATSWSWEKEHGSLEWDPVEEDGMVEYLKKEAREELKK